MQSSIRAKSCPARRKFERVTAARLLLWVALSIVTLMFVACGDESNGPRNAASPAADIVAQPPTPAGVQPPECQVQSMAQIGSSGGGLDWSPVDNSLLLIADTDSNGIKQVYTIRVDGSEKTCLTCGQVPGGPPVDVHKGVAHWSPDGAYIFMQVEQTDHGGNRRMSEPGSGRHNDIWATTADGSQWWRLTDYSDNDAAGVLFPVPSHSGNRLAWAERYEGPEKPVAALVQFAFGHTTEDLWGQWRLNIAEIVWDTHGPRLENIQQFKPGNATFYEMQAWSPDDSKIYFAANINRDTPHTIDIWSMDLNSQELTPLTNTDDEWEEHVSISPSGNKIALMSSECCEWDPDKLLTLVAEVYLVDADGSDKVQLTHYNMPGYPESSKQSVAAKMVWSPDGTRMAIQRILISEGTRDASAPTDLWILTFAGPCGLA